MFMLESTRTIWNGGVLLIIDARHERAASWYASHGTLPLSDHPLALVIPLATIASDLEKNGLLGRGERLAIHLPNRDFGIEIEQMRPGFLECQPHVLTL